MLGLVLALGAVAIAQWWHGGSLLTLLDGPAFVIVVRGEPGGAVIAQTPRRYLLRALQATWMLFPAASWILRAGRAPEGVGSVRPPARLAGAGKPGRGRPDPFTRQGLSMIVDGVSIEDIRSLLEADIDIEQERTSTSARVFRVHGGTAPPSASSGP